MHINREKHNTRDAHQQPSYLFTTSTHHYTLSTQRPLPPTHHIHLPHLYNETDTQREPRTAWLGGGQHPLTTRTQHHRIAQRSKYKTSMKTSHFLLRVRCFLFATSLRYIFLSIRWRSFRILFSSSCCCEHFSCAEYFKRFGSSLCVGYFEKKIINCVYIVRKRTRHRAAPLTHYHAW